jgi:small subunit ribosomal protein S9
VIEQPPEDERQDDEPAAPSESDAPPLEETHVSTPGPADTEPSVPADAEPSTPAADSEPAAESEPAADSEPAAESEPEPSTPAAGTEPAAAEPTAAADSEPAAEPPAPTSEEPEAAPTEQPSEQPVAAQVPPASAAAASAEGEPPAQAGPAAAPPAETGVAPASMAPSAESDELEEEEELTPRQKPEIPGADLTPDIVPEGEQFLDAEARAAAEAEAEAAAAREEEPEDQAMPIADAAIDLAAGARYTATGKRKTAVARVILRPGTGTYSINGKPLEAFFPRDTLQRMIRQPLETVGYDSRMDVVARMHGGGVAAQAGALRHGISRALIVADPHLRGELKRRGFLTRDPRVKERKKAGLKKARKRPQFSKR